MRDFFSECGTWGIMEGDCLERLQELPEGCADLVLIDPPYGTIKGITGIKDWECGKMDWDNAIAPDEPETLDVIPINEEIPDWL